MAKSVNLIGKSIRRFLTWFLEVFITICLIGVICGMIVGGALLIYVQNYLDTSVDGFEILASDKASTTVVSYVNEKGEIVQMDSERLNTEENRVWVPFDQIGEDIKNAFIAIEDKRFYSHEGVDWITTFKATLNYVTGSGSRGGSTITQQLIKNITGDDQVTIQRKIQEIFRALNFEKEYSKEQILEMYLNNIYLSEGCYGIGAASYTYFGKNAADLTLIESAAIAAITQNPSYWDPFIFPEHNAERRNYILEEMYSQGLISQEEFTGAYQKDLVLFQEEEDDDSTSSVHSWYTDAAQLEAIRLLQDHFGYTPSVAEKALLTGGFNIVIAQDPSIQAVVDDYFQNDANWEKVDDSAVQPKSACVIIDPQNGNILALVGDRGTKTINLGLNYATQTRRPSGSSIKPLSVYGPGIDAKVFTYASVFDDVPLNFAEYYDSNGKLHYGSKHGYPKNSPDIYRGLTNVNQAVTVSVNTIAMRALQKVGLENSFNFLTTKVGLSTLIRSETFEDGSVFTDIALAPLALGEFTWGVTLKEMTAGYQIFANGGIYNEERLVLKILDSDGNVVVDNEKKSSIAISPQAASVMTKILQNVCARGNAEYIKIYKKQIDSTNLAGKTGTTDSNRDRWFIGYNPYYVCGVWTGYANPRSLAKFDSHYTASMKAWDTIMTAITMKYKTAEKEGGEHMKKFELAPGVVKATYCYDSGKLMTDACKADPRNEKIKNRAEIGYFIAGTEPTEYCDVHVMVDYDKVTKGIATPYCPSGNVTKVGLIKVNRKLPFNIRIYDSQFTCVDLPDNYSYQGLTSDQPYYANILPNGFYAGKGLSSQFNGHYNHVCTKHLSAPATPVDPVPVVPDNPVVDPVPAA